MDRLRKYSRNILILGALGLWSASTFAQDSDGTDLEISLTPYLWGTAIDGTSTVGSPPPLEIDATFSDLLSNLNMAKTDEEIEQAVIKVRTLCED